MKYLNPAFQYVEKEDQEYEIDIDAHRIHAGDLDSHIEKSEKLNVLRAGNRFAASPMGLSKGMSASQVSSYQMVDYNLDQEEHD